MIRIMTHLDDALSLREQKQVARKFCLVAPGFCLAKQDFFPHKPVPSFMCVAHVVVGAMCGLSLTLSLADFPPLSIGGLGEALNGDIRLSLKDGKICFMLLLHDRTAIWWRTSCMLSINRTCP